MEGANDISSDRNLGMGVFVSVRRAKKEMLDLMR